MASFLEHFLALLIYQWSDTSLRMGKISIRVFYFLTSSKPNNVEPESKSILIQSKLLKLRLSLWIHVIVSFLLGGTGHISNYKKKRENFIARYLKQNDLKSTRWANSPGVVTRAEVNSIPAFTHWVTSYIWDPAIPDLGCYANSSFNGTFEMHFFSSIFISLFFCIRLGSGLEVGK